MKRFTLNRVFVLYTLAFVLIVSGAVPRVAILPVAALLLLWAALTPREEATLFFVRAVPLFIALPLTAGYDNLNLWRPFALVLAMRTLWSERSALWSEFTALRRAPLAWFRTHPIAAMLATLFFLAALSLIGATAPITGAVRIIYFANLCMVPIVLWRLATQGRLPLERVLRSIALVTGIVVAVGFLQLLSTYLIDIYQFMRLWGEGIQLRQFGTEWSYIATQVGNTWLAYYGPQLSLRVFSLFTDSHTFPLFVLLGLPALAALALGPVIARAGEGFWPMLRTRARWTILGVPLALLAVIVSGTRGMWAGGAGIALLILPALWWMRRRVDVARRRVFGYTALFIVIFAMLFAVAWPIFISPQFLLSKGDWNLLGNRVRSIIDFGETSNALRLAIWRASAESIVAHPLLGVGIGNYPVVLGQDIRLARAGSTAHNVYLHVAAEMGIPAALAFIGILAGVMVALWRWFTRASGAALAYAATALWCIPWVYAYLLTDAALFDERAFLGFAITAAVIFAYGKRP